MGAVASSLSKPHRLTAKEFDRHASTKEIHALSDDLFKFMYDKYKLNDMLDIADNPGEYVIAISDLITAQFHVLGYTTAKNKFGEIYFKKWEELDPPKTQDEYRTIAQGSNTTRKGRLNKYMKNSEVERKQSKQLEHAKHAKIIAFYFVRIFQILGSLLLVVKDTKLPELGSFSKKDSQIVADRAYAGQAASVIKGFNPPRSLQSGGTIYNFPMSKPLGPFEFLRKYLREYDNEYVKQFKDDYNAIIPDPKNGYYKFNYSDNLFLKVTLPNPLPDSVGAKPKAGSEQELCILTKDRNNTISLKSIKITVTEFRTLTGASELNDFKAPSEYSDKKKQLERYPVSVTINTKVNTIDFSAQFQPLNMLEKSESGYPNGKNYILVSMGKNDLYEALNNEYDPEKQFVEILEVYAIKSLLKDKSSGSGFSRFIPVKKDKTNDSKDPSAIKGPVKNKGLMATFNELYNKDHKPHCIARALDLLDQASINDEEREKAKGETKICTSSIKGKGTSYQPLKSISQLFGKLKVKSLLVDGEEFKRAEKVLTAFVGKDSQSNPLSVDELKGMKQDDEANEMSNAIRRLTEAFNMNNKLVSEIKNFDDINLEGPSACARTGIQKGEIIKGRPEFIEMQKYAQQLLAFHLNNVIGITEFLKTIFNLKQRPDGSWEVKGPNTELLFAGYETLDEITSQARQLLVNYYSGCEMIYQKGVKTWVESLPATSALPGQRVLLEPSAPRASAPLASAPVVASAPSASAGPNPI